MLEFPRWKYAAGVAGAAGGGAAGAAEPLRQDPALQVERKNRAPMDDAARQAIETLLRKDQIPIKRDYIDNGRLILVFNDVTAQLKARDAVDAR